ncbi:hypothetical protein BO78DRAFT_454769 [Aspergillus sclerotiicarbonarius CBS 121057]|uniref:Deoxyribonuclease NucA/NucB domain-containing protein n=1 Tax=Aspergillus sclerotiicarbonarius (strain CBS 121057 / IBT 28362) TaxID=1448318 RepID=A0A319EE10_ASPSB|nr:hypothetical protein BO78DRAFT_454769 [Aspergillus sclerotiicarbonarius CBS 121057]
MHTPKSLVAFTLYMATIHSALAVPLYPAEDVTLTNLEIRAAPVAGPSKGHPIKATMEVNDNNALPFDADYYAILCLGKDPIFQRDGSESKDNRKDAGVKKTFPGGKGTGPFRNPTMANVKIPGSQYVSPEEFPFASTTQGGHQAILFPVSEASQDSQGGALNSFYNKHHIQSAHQGKNSWYEITGWSGQLGPYCKALQNNKGKTNKNDPICKTGSNGKGKWGFDVGEYTYTYDDHSYHKAQGSK